MVCILDHVALENEIVHKESAVLQYLAAYNHYNPNHFQEPPTRYIKMIKEV